MGTGDRPNIEQVVRLRKMRKSWTAIDQMSRRAAQELIDRQDRWEAELAAVYKNPEPPRVVYQQVREYNNINPYRDLEWPVFKPFAIQGWNEVEGMLYEHKEPAPRVHEQDEAAYRAQQQAMGPQDGVPRMKTQAEANEELRKMIENYRVVLDIQEDPLGDHRYVIRKNRF